MIYIKKLLKALVWPIIFILGQFFIQYIFVSVFNYNESKNISSTEFLQYIKTVEYQEKLNNYINNNAILIVVLVLLIFIPIFYKIFKKYKQNNSFNFKKIIILILLGISISLAYNVLIFESSNVFKFINYNISSLPLITQIICSGICGPILEEFVFRGIMYNKLKEFNKPFISKILVSIVFGLIHSNMVDAIYAFMVSFILIDVYERYKSLKASIILHISLNLTIIFMSNLIVLNYLPFNIYLLVISIITILILKKIKFMYK